MIRKETLAALAVLLAGSAAAAVPPPPAASLLEHPWRLRVDVPAERLAPLVAELRARGWDVPFVDPKHPGFDVVGGAHEFEQLEALGVPVRIVEDAFGLAAPKSPGALSDYLDPAEIEARLAEYEAAYPALAMRIPYAVDHEGRTAWALKISDHVKEDEDEPAVLFVAQHHAREVMTPEVALDIVDQLLTGYGIDPAVTHWVDSTEIFVVPTDNPDGSAWVFSNDANWRKNRRVNGDGTLGVDLNRNYPFQWGNTVCNGSSADPASDTWHGPAGGSEPTTAGLMALARAHRPVYAVSYHTYGELAIHPYGCGGEYAGQPDAQLLREAASEVSAAMKADDATHWFRFGTPFELSSEVDGEFFDWIYAELGTFGVTFELNDPSLGFQPSYATWRTPTVLRARPGWRYWLDRLDRGRLTGHVLDACTGGPLDAQVGLREQVFGHGETPRRTVAGTGRFDWPVLPGHYTVLASLPGYAAQAWPIDAAFAPAAREVRLVPSGSYAAAVSSIAIAEVGGDGDGQLDPGETADLTLEAYATGGDVTGLTATVTTSDPFVTVLDGRAGFGNVAAGTRAGASGPVRIALAPDTPDEHVAALDVAFAADQPLCTAAPVPAAVRVTRGTPACPAIFEPLDHDPGWTIDNGGAAGGWAFGVPSGVGPSSAYSGTNVYGTNLSGNYADDADYLLTAGPFDLSSLRHAELRFARWLRSEPGHDIARVQLRVGPAGPFTTVWEGFGRDAAWVPLRYDVSALADFAGEVWVRFELASDAQGNDAGFYVDDVSFCGEQAIGVDGAVKYKSYAVIDTDPAYGNGNGRLDLEETATLRVGVVNTTLDAAKGVTGVLTTTTPGIEIHDAVARFDDLPSGASGTSLAPHFTVTAHDGCGSSASFALTLRWNDGARATSTFSVPIGQITESTRLSDDFEAARGWTAGGDALAGQFVREDPHGVVDATIGTIQPEDDATPEGAVCYVTGNPPVGPGFDPYSGDVDRGTTYILSPVFDGTGGGSLLVRFARFFHRTNVTAVNEGWYRARISNNGGATWVELESLAVDASAWTRQEIDATKKLAPTTNMRLRFEAQEVRRTSGDPLIELAIDDVSVVRRDVQCGPFRYGETHPPGAVGNTVQVARTFDDVVLAWTAPAIDAMHDAARFFPVYRSASPSSGFVQAGETTAPAWYDADAALPASGSRFYLVAARNAAGNSGEGP